jgi:hypothetical protein
MIHAHGLDRRWTRPGDQMSASNKGFVLVEAQNIQQAVFDTGQLSVIRGGSYLLSRAVEKIQSRYRDQLQSLSIGGSSGLFRVRSDQDDPSRLSARIADWLSSHPLYQGFSFAVESCRAAELEQAREILHARAHFRQLRQPSVVPDQMAGTSEYPCALHGTRRAQSEPSGVQKKQSQPLSRSVALRLVLGRQLRADLAFRILRRVLDESENSEINPSDRALLGSVSQALRNIRFTDDLETLAANDRYRALGNKIAVIYLDGNRFGAIQRRHAKDAPTQQRFDQTLRCNRAVLLAKLLQALMSAADDGSELADALIPADSKTPRRLRLETLLWGGDEMTLVVPAWLGFEVMQRLYAATGHWRFGERLTHAGGLVFCHANTPIDRVRYLAQQLAEDVKTAQQSAPKPSDCFDYLVLESVDYPIEPTLAEFRAGRYGANNLVHRQPLVPIMDWNAAARARFQRLLCDGVLSRGQVFRLARRLRDEPPEALFGPFPSSEALPWQSASHANVTRTPSLFEQAEQRLLALALEPMPADAAAETETDLAQIAAALGCDSVDQRRRAWLWLHLTELWDYLVPTRDRKAEVPNPKPDPNPDQP